MAGPYYITSEGKIPLNGSGAPMLITQEDWEDCCCEAPIGACCLEETCYADMTQVDCEDGGGVWQGADTTCDPDPCAPPPTPCTCVVGQAWVCNPSQCAGWQQDSDLLYGCYDFDGYQLMCGDISTYDPPGPEGWSGSAIWWEFGDTSDIDNCNDDCAALWATSPPYPTDPCDPCGTCCDIPEGDPCQDSLYEYECDALGGTWYEGGMPCEECP